MTGPLVDVKVVRIRAFAYREDVNVWRYGGENQQGTIVYASPETFDTPRDAERAGQEWLDGHKNAHVPEALAHQAAALRDHGRA